MAEVETKNAEISTKIVIRDNIIVFDTLSEYPVPEYR